MLRKVSARPIVPLLLSVCLVLGGASASVAAPRFPYSPRLPAHLNRSVLPRWVRSALKPAAGKEQVFSGFGATFRQAGSPYYWEFDVTRLPASFVLQVTGSKRLINGTESHYWFFRLPRGDGSIGRELHTARLNTGADLGSFGKIDLTFSSFRRLKSHVFRCPATHVIQERDFYRRGTLRGTFNFIPGEGTLPTLSKSVFAAGIGRSVSTGAPCPGDKIHHVCAGTDASLVDTSQGTVVYGSKGGGFGGANQIFTETIEHRGRATILHSIDAYTADTPVFRFTQTGLRVDGSMLSPFASGSLNFNTGPVRVVHHLRCNVTITRQTWTSGTLDITYDSGTVSLTPPGLLAREFVGARP